MDIAVCIKQIINPETPFTAFRIDPEARRAIPAKDQPLVINDYDAVAVEAAIRIKEANGGRVTVISLGASSALSAIKHCLAMGADEGFLLCDSLFREEDRSVVAYILATAIKKIGQFDLIFCGRQEGDWDADVVVCGGRGIGGPEGFKQLSELARLLKGAVGATRPPCEDELMPEQCQIGLTGKIVSPRLYMGVALSGSSQHIAGMSGSKNIVAINKDPEANIFSIAHYGAMGDYRKILPAFIEKCKDEL